MKNIIFWEENGQNEVLDLIIQIAEQGIMGDKNAQTLARYIREGLEILRNLELPPNKKIQHVFNEDNGDLRTIQLTKPLVSKPPLLEFRINRSSPGAFRAIYFEYEENTESYIIFTKALLKQLGESNPPELQQKINDSFKMYLSLLEDPSKIIGKGDSNE